MRGDSGSYPTSYPGYIPNYPNDDRIRSFPLPSGFPHYYPPISSLPPNMLPYPSPYMMYPVNGPQSNDLNSTPTPYVNQTFMFNPYVY